MRKRKPRFFSQRRPYRRRPYSRPRWRLVRSSVDAFDVVGTFVSDFTWSGP